MFGYQSLHSLGTRASQVSPGARHMHPTCGPKLVCLMELPQINSASILLARSYSQGHTKITEAWEMNTFL